MRTAAPKGGGVDADRKTAEPGFSISSAAALQAPCRRLGVICAEIVTNLRRQRAAACSERVAEDFPGDIQIAIGSMDTIVAEGRP